MSVSMLIIHRHTGKSEEVPVATLSMFRSVWMPAAERLGLTLVPQFAFGALTVVWPEAVPQIIDEVRRLRAWAESQPDGEYLVERCGMILAAFERTDPATCEYSFG